MIMRKLLLLLAFSGFLCGQVSQFPASSGGGGSTSPGGSDKQIQYKDGSAFGASAALTANTTVSDIAWGVDYDALLSVAKTISDLSVRPQSGAQINTTFDSSAAVSFSGPPQTALSVNAVSAGAGSMDYISGMDVNTGVDFAATTAAIVTGVNGAAYLNSDTATVSNLNGVTAYVANYRAGGTITQQNAFKAYAPGNTGTVAKSVAWFNENYAGSATESYAWLSEGGENELHTGAANILGLNLVAHSGQTEDMLHITASDETTVLAKIDKDGKVDAAAYKVSGTVGLSATKTVKGSDGNNCNLVFTSGLLTSTTCP